MPQYYLPLLKFLRNYVGAFVRDVVSTGAVSLEDFINPHIKTTCSLTGNLCQPSCKYYFEECKYKNYNVFAYTIGLIYIFLKLNQTNIVYERDFQMVIHTGKKYSDYLDNWEFYDIIESVDNVINNVEKIEEKPVDGFENKYKYVYSELLPQLEKNRISQIENIEKMMEDFEKRKGKIPEHLKVLKGRLNNVKYNTIRVLSYRDIFSYISDYITNSKYGIRVIRELLRYLVEDFIPTRDDDFPYSVISANEGNLEELIRATVNFDKDNPKKWTDERVNKFRNETNPYKKLLIFDSNMLLWEKYILPSYIKVNDVIIRTKYILDEIIRMNLKHGSSNHLIFSFDNIFKFKRYLKVVRALTDIIEDSLGFGLEVFLSENQLKYQAVFNREADTGKFLLRIMSIEDKPIPDDIGKMFDILEEEGYIKRFRVFK